MCMYIYVCVYINMYVLYNLCKYINISTCVSFQFSFLFFSFFLGTIGNEYQLGERKEQG